ILAVIAFTVGEAEEPLLQDRIASVPEREREAETLLVVGDAGDPVLAPAIGARAGLIVAEVVPGVAAVAVVLADRAPLPLAEIRAPFAPGNLLLPGLAQPVMLGGHGSRPPVKNAADDIRSDSVAAELHPASHPRAGPARSG